MALQIIERRWCDGLKLGAEGDFVVRHDPGVEGITRTFALDGGKPRNVDLCDPCNEDMTLAELRACLKEFGVSTEAGKKGKGEERQAALSGGPGTTAARFHMSGVRHGRTPKGERDMQCLWCPLNYTPSGFLGHVRKAHGFDGSKDALGTTCPACGNNFEMLGAHVLKSHPEFGSVTDAFFWARDNNDPYGVYGARRAAGKNVVEALP